ncbi:MAG: 4-(cytidine 5'-diphospho)-2-C-methyl-D-erythritol kinase [Alphaproteobacteria bacterium]|nr:4-(cytidine 5'-diphospho)-2-C-methyl-D-erythritol kinase [Alphaproteobacteria bacterium]
MAFLSFHSESAPAKLNLALQVLGRQDDGYHSLDSLVVFLEYGDVLHGEREEGDVTHLITEGAYANALGEHTDNLVQRAAQLLRVKSGTHAGARLTLQKNIPIGAGLGGGSADAAAALRLLNRLWDLEYSIEELAHIGAELGADVPACVMSVPARMQGVGEQLLPVAGFPATDCVVVYPASPLWTADVFRALQERDYSGEMPPLPALEGDISLWKLWLNETRNDLLRPAEHLNPAVKQALHALSRTTGNVFVRMSGSGSACFALYANPQDAEAAKLALRAQYSDYWVVQTRIQAA